MQQMCNKPMCFLTSDVYIENQLLKSMTIWTKTSLFMANKNYSFFTKWDRIGVFLVFFLAQPRLDWG